MCAVFCSGCISDEGEHPFPSEVLGSRYLQPPKPGWQMPPLFLQPWRDWSLFIALCGLLLVFCA